MKLRVVLVCGHFGFISCELEQETAPVGELVSTMEVARHATRLHGCSRVSVKLWISAARAACVWRKASRSALPRGTKQYAIVSRDAGVFACGDPCASHLEHVLQVTRLQDCQHSERSRQFCVSNEQNKSDHYDSAFDLHVYQLSLSLGY